ncbi:MAG: hypothetical protein ACFE9D_07940 [Promethearchaeota archaeon]
MKFEWLKNWVQFAFVAMLCGVASIVDLILGSLGAVTIGIIFTAFFVIITISMIILGFIIARTQKADNTT